METRDISAKHSVKLFSFLPYNSRDERVKSMHGQTDLHVVHAANRRIASLNT